MRKAPARIVLVLATGMVLGGCTVTVAGTATADRTGASRAPTARPAPSHNAAPTPVPDPSGDLFDDPQGRFGLVPPPNWTVDTSGTRGTAVVFLDPQPTPSAAGPFTANINVLVLPRAADLSTTVVDTRQQLAGLADYGSTADEPFTLGDGTPAHVLGGTFTDPGSGFELRNLQLLTVAGDSTIVVTGTATAQSWAIYQTPLDTSLRTLTVVT